MAGKVIGLTGPIGSGKGEVAKILMGHGFVSIGFADPLKEGLRAILDEPRETYEDRVLKEAVIDDLGLSRRELMKSIGHDWGRNLIPGGIWIRLMQRRLPKLLASGADVVIHDVRYENWADLVRDHGVMCHIDNPRVERQDHGSEAALEFKPGDMAILNHGTLDELREHVRVLTETPLRGVAA